MVGNTSLLTVSEFLGLSASDRPCEFIEGMVVKKVSPQRFHASLQAALLVLLRSWCEEWGDAYPELALLLKRKGVDWVPVPDLTCISFDRWPQQHEEDGPCPVPPELAVEIVSPGQTSGAMAEKATDYLAAGVSRVWVVDPQAKSFTIYYPDKRSQTFTKSAVIQDPLLPGWQLTVSDLFQQAKIP